MYKRIVLALVLIFGLVTVTGVADTLPQISRDLSSHAQKVSKTLNHYFEGELSWTQVNLKFDQYKETAQDLYLRSLGTDNPEFIRIIAGYSLAIDLYNLGVEKFDPKYIDAANKLLSKLVTPALQAMT